MWTDTIPPPFSTLSYPSTTLPVHHSHNKYLFSDLLQRDFIHCGSKETAQKSSSALLFSCKMKTTEMNKT